jgi:hypothetical protein
MPILSFKSMDPSDQPPESDTTLELLPGVALSYEDECKAIDAFMEEFNKQPDTPGYIPPAGPRVNIFRTGKNSPQAYLPSGFPQGANISPFLSILQLAMGATARFAKLIMYADDGLFYSDKPFTAEDVADHFQSLGVNVAPEKSGFVRKRGY